ncbi:hypothetical protein PZA11_000241 [Diplocarpon coronariae]
MFLLYRWAQRRQVAKHQAEEKQPSLSPATDQVTTTAEMGGREVAEEAAVGGASEPQGEGTEKRGSRRVRSGASSCKYNFSRETIPADVAVREACGSRVHACLAVTRLVLCKLYKNSNWL